MIDTANWIGRAKPIKDTYAAKLYWNTATPAKDLADEFACANPAHVNKIAGPAVLDLRCIDCNAFKIATSRSDAQSDLARPNRYRCEPYDRAERDRKQREQWAKWKRDGERKEELRWMPYKDYLGTDEWSERRKKVIRRAEFKCQVCAAGGRLHVHHRTYIRRGVERIEDMIALCAECHEIFHRNGKLSEGGRAA